MYSGLVLTKYSGRLMGVHQKIDRIARRHVAELLPAKNGFPTISAILKFEGKNGPDGIKRKSPSHNEPWHYLDPLSGDTEGYLELLEVHYRGLVDNLKAGNKERASFEAAWLAHAVVDGLTPAHHYPYEEKIAELRGGRSKESRNSISEKLLYKGDNAIETIVNTAKAYGPKGVATSHTLFEMGVTVIIRPLRLPDARPIKADFKELENKGYQQYFLHKAREIAVYNFYERYLETGWTTKLSNQVRHHLVPALVKTVTVMWYSAAKEAGLCE